jgi:hypothetical protein
MAITIVSLLTVGVAACLASISIANPRRPDQR